MPKIDDPFDIRMLAYREFLIGITLKSLRAYAVPGDQLRRVLWHGVFQTLLFKQEQRSKYRSGYLS